MDLEMLVAFCAGRVGGGSWKGARMAKNGPAPHMENRGVSLTTFSPDPLHPGFVRGVLFGVCPVLGVEK